MVPPLSFRRKCPAVPVAPAVPLMGVLLSAFEPDEAAAAQSDARLYVTRTEPLSAVAQVAGAEPVRISMIADVPTVV